MSSRPRINLLTGMPMDFQPAPLIGQYEAHVGSHEAPEPCNCGRCREDFFCYGGVVLEEVAGEWFVSQNSDGKIIAHPASHFTSMREKKGDDFLNNEIIAKKLCALPANQSKNPAFNFGGNAGKRKSGEVTAKKPAGGDAGAMMPKKTKTTPTINLDDDDDDVPLSVIAKTARKKGASSSSEEETPSLDDF